MFSLNGQIPNFSQKLLTFKPFQSDDVLKLIECQPNEKFVNLRR